MYNKKYILTKIEEFNRHNPIYNDVEGSVCYLVYLNPGERGWFLYENNELYNLPHRIHTSVIKNVEYLDDRVIVETQNTRLIFEVTNNVRGV